MWDEGGVCGIRGIVCGMMGGVCETNGTFNPRASLVTFCNVMELMMLDVAAVGSSNDN